MSDFKIAAFINDATFSANLAYACNSLGYGLSFPQLENHSLTENCVIIDLNDQSLNPFALGKKLKENDIVLLHFFNFLFNIFIIVKDLFVKR